MSKQNKVPTHESCPGNFLPVVRYLAQVFVPLNPGIISIIQSDEGRLSQVAEEFLFKQIKHQTGKVSFIKANPLFSVTITFIDDGVLLKAETTKPNLLKYFKRLFLGELSAILSCVKKSPKDETDTRYIS